MFEIIIYRGYLNNMVGDVKANPKDFYQYINYWKKDTQSIPPEKGVAQSDLGEGRGIHLSDYQWIF